MLSLIAKWPEVAFAAATVAIVAVLSIACALPFNLPSGERAAFVGVHYLYPLIGLCVWVFVAAVGQRRQLASTFLVALPCYAIVLVCHFNIKLWAPHMNPLLWDDLYWRIDQLLRPLVDASFTLRRALAPVLPLDSNMYMIAFIVMFYVSFCFHAVRTPSQFRKLFLAALLLQGLGAFAYLAMPAIGPFLYEPGVETAPTAAQASMLGAWHANVAGREEWLAQYGSTHLTVGLAAMPSLHSGASFLFLLFAIRYGRVLLPLYVPLFAYICVAAVANRWHYLIDIPAGMLLAWMCAAVAERLAPSPEVSALNTPRKERAVPAVVNCGASAELQGASPTPQSR